MTLPTLLKSLSVLPSRNRLSILIYHQVLERKDPLRPSEPSVAEFTRQMQLVSRYLHPLPLARAVELLQAGRLPGNAVAITFDDGYCNNLQRAAPVLARLGIPATFFVTTGFMHGAMWNDQLIELVRHCQGRTLDLDRLAQAPVVLDSTAACLQAIQNLLGQLKHRPWQERRELATALLGDHGLRPLQGLMMDAPQIRELHRLGFEIGGHTHDHPILAVQSAAEQRDQIAINKEQLEVIIGEPLRGFAYPNGRPHADFNDESVSAVRELGFRYAVTTAKGVSRPNTDPCRLHRFTPWNRQMGKFYLRFMQNVVRG